MELYQIRYFLAACETLNFTRAAERCHVSQPALTRAIKKLEAELGGFLFRRERSHPQLTDLGRLMEARLRLVLEQTEDARAEAGRMLGLERATLRLGVMCTVGPLRILAFLTAFRREQPGIEISVHDVTPASIIDDLMDGRLDAAIVGLPVPYHERLDRIRLYDERMMIAFAPGHRLAGRDRVSIRDLDGEAYLDRVNCEFRSIFMELVEEMGIEVRVAFSSEREDWIQSMLLAGMGVSVMPEDSISLSGVEARPTTDPALSRSVEIVTVAGRAHAPALATFLGAARTYRWAA